MYFNNDFQTLIISGYSNDLLVYEIDPVMVDYQFMGKMKGHKNYISSIVHLPGSPVVITGD